LSHARVNPLPVQALDHATGYLTAAAAVRGLALRLSKGQATSAGLSLARTAALLIGTPRQGIEPKALSPIDADYSAAIEATDWGSAHRALPPVRVAGAPMGWTRPASGLGSVPAEWIFRWRGRTNGERSDSRRRRNSP
jgi:hypothetical protein